MVNQKVTIFLVLYTFISLFTSHCAKSQEIQALTETPTLQVHHILSKINIHLIELLGNDQHGQPALGHLNALPMLCQEQELTSERVGETLRKELGYNREDFDTMSCLQQALNAPLPLYSLLFSGKEIPTPMLESLNCLFQTLLDYRPHFSEEPILNKPILNTSTLTPPFFFSLSLTRTFGPALTPSYLSSRIRELLASFSYWKDSETFTPVDNVGTCPPTFSMLKTDHYTSIVTRVATDATDDQLKITAGNLSATEVLRAILLEYSELLARPFQILIPLAQSQATRRHFTLLTIKSIAGTSQISAQLYDPKYFQQWYDPQEIYRQASTVLPSLKIMPAYYSGHQTAFNTTDCGRYGAAYIYLIITKNLFPEATDLEKAEMIINQLFLADQAPKDNA